MNLTEIQLKETRLALYDVLKKLDKIKIKLMQDKVSKKELLKIIDGDINE